MRFNDRGIRIVLASVLLAVAFAVLIVAAPSARALNGVSVSAPTLAQPLAASADVQVGWTLPSSALTAQTVAHTGGARPMITNISSTSAKPGSRLTLWGRGFSARRGKGRVLFGAFKSTSYVRWSATKIVCKVPGIPAGKLLVKVRTARGTSRGWRFTVEGPPAAALMKLGTVDWMRTASYDWWWSSTDGAGNRAIDTQAWASPDLLAYYTDSAGNLAIVTQDSDTATLTISTIDPSTLQRVGDTRSISHAGWPLWGGFYAGPDGCFYVLVGRENPNEQDDRDVVAVRRYDRNWTLAGTAYVKGGASQIWKGIYSPFDAGAPHMVLVGNRLVVHMGRLLYAIEGVNHQANFTFEVDVDTMTATTFDWLGYANCGHSFQQLVAMNGSNLVLIDHGDAYPRAIQMGVMAGYPAQRQVSTYDLFEFNGAIGDNITGATVTGLVSGPSGIVVVGNSIRQPDAPDGPLDDTERRNIYAIWADPATGEHTVRWLTDFAPQGASFALEPRVVQVGPDRYAVLFGVHNDSGYRMEYRLIDSAGTVLASTSFSGVFFCAMSDPILLGGKVYWVGIEPDRPYGYDYLFGINVSDPTTPSLLSRAAP